MLSLIKQTNSVFFNNLRLILKTMLPFLALVIAVRIVLHYAFLGALKNTYYILFGVIFSLILFLIKLVFIREIGLSLNGSDKTTLTYRSVLSSAMRRMVPFAALRIIVNIVSFSVPGILVLLKIFFPALFPTQVTVLSPISQS